MNIGILRRANIEKQLNVFDDAYSTRHWVRYTNYNTLTF